ncbi:MAG: sodium ion-translocating decarboxylase subunit beta, partial [Pseudomonadota bacterium]
MDIAQAISKFVDAMGFGALSWQQAVMILVSFGLMYLAVVRKFEPLLLLPIAFGTFLVNLPMAKEVLFMEPAGGHPGGLFWYLFKGVEYDIFPPLIFLGIGALTDFGPLIANPVTFLLGA